MNAMGKVTLRGISHGAIVGVTGDRIRAATMRRALQNQPVGSKLIVLNVALLVLIATGM